MKAPGVLVDTHPVRLQSAIRVHGIDLTLTVLAAQNDWAVVVRPARPRGGYDVYDGLDRWKAGWAPTLAGVVSLVQDVKTRRRVRAEGLPGW